MKKIKVLSVGECSYLHSGYARYNHGLLTELNKNPKFHIQEYGLFYNPISNKANTVEWEFYPNIPPEFIDLNSNEKVEGWKSWASHTPNHMGAPLFEAILLESQPDVIIANNDAWQLRYLIDSPYRRFYKLCCLFACDSVPQNWNWIEDMKLCDGVLTYSNWAKEEIEKQTPEVKIDGVVSPSCQPSFQPLNKKMVKEEMGLAPNSKIIGTVMRNQVRKLFPALFSTFNRFLEKTGDQDTYLYVHSKYPDGSWCFPQLIQEYGIAHRVLFTYQCQAKECKHVFPSLFQDIAQCPRCNNFSGMMPGTMDGVTSEELCKIYNCMDLYVQYSIAEGFGLPQVEAASCGVPVVTVDYSAMKDMKSTLGAEMVNVLALNRDMNTGQDRAIPDDNHLLEILISYFNKPSSIRNILGMKTRKMFEQNYGFEYLRDWNKIAKTWGNVIESVYSGPSDWRGEPCIHEPAPKTNKHMSNIEYARWLIKDVAGLHYRLNSFYENEIIRNLNYGCKAHLISNGGAQEYNRDIAYDEFKQIGESRKIKEMYRLRKMGLING